MQLESKLNLYQIATLIIFKNVLNTPIPEVNEEFKFYK